MSSIKKRNDSIKTASNFIDLEEIKHPVEINLNNKNKISSIDSIEYTTEKLHKEIDEIYNKYLAYIQLV